MDDNILHRTHATYRLIWEDNHALRFMLGMREITMLFNFTPVADAKRTWNL